MANVSYSVSNNKCIDDQKGYIIIDNITFEASEIPSFTSYEILWSGDFHSTQQIAADSRSASFLSNGSYSFVINSLIDSNQLGPYNITISSPNKLEIINVRYDPFICANTTGSVYLDIQGGLAPYTILSNLGPPVTTSLTSISIDGFTFGTGSIRVIDSNGCSATWSKELIFNDSTITINNIEVISPTLLDSYGIIKFNINGYGPFNMVFQNQDSDETIFIDALQTEYLTNVSNNSYSYIIRDKIIPGNYILTVSNNYGCSYETTFRMNNIVPITTNISVINNTPEIIYNPILTLPIFDVIFIPYQHIQNNTSLWQLIKQFNLKDKISVKINDTVQEFVIVRNMLDKYCLNENKIEILRLDNNSKNWFFYFYIAPSINIDNDNTLLNATYKIVDPTLNIEHDLILGLNEYNSIDSEVPSLLRGSFLLDGLGYNQFVNSNTISSYQKNNVYVKLGDDDLENYDFLIKNTNKQILKNIYTADYVTTLNFLEQFHRLNEYVNIRDTACNMSLEDYQYVLKIKHLLKSINNFDNINNIYVYNIDTTSNNGQISVAIAGNNILQTEDGTVTNAYDISYYTFDENSSTLQTFVMNNNVFKNTILSNIKERYIIVRIKDIYQNITRNLVYNSNTFNYDLHFVAAKSILQKYNKNIMPYFMYGDILVYVGAQPPIQDPIVPQPVPAIPTPIETETPSIDIVQQTLDASNTANLTINLYKNIKCIIQGPKNYQHTFSKNTQFTNMIPGVYIIIGDNEDLFNNNLYQQEYRIIVNKNTSSTVDIDFVSYQDQIFIKDI